jgi:hypothetical protein
MTPTGARRLLRNRVYLGELRVGDEVNPAAHPPLVDVELFEAAQAVLDNSVRPPRGEQEVALLSGLVRCASCGHVMGRTRNAKWASYSCRVNHSRSRCPAPAHIGTARLDPLIEAVALREIAKLRITASLTGGVEEARAALRSAERELAAYVESVSVEDIGREAFAAGAKSRRERVDAAQEQLRLILARAPALPSLGSAEEVWGELTVHEQNVLLRGLLEAVVVERVGRGQTVPVAERVSVLPYGAGVVERYGGAGRAMGIVPIDRDDIAALCIPLVEDGLQDEGRVS